MTSKKINVIGYLDTKKYSCDNIKNDSGEINDYYLPTIIKIILLSQENFEIENILLVTNMEISSDYIPMFLKEMEARLNKLRNENNDIVANKDLSLEKYKEKICLNFCNLEKMEEIDKIIIDFYFNSKSVLFDICSGSIQIRYEFQKIALLNPDDTKKNYFYINTSKNPTHGQNEERIKALESTNKHWTEEEYSELNSSYKKERVKYKAPDTQILYNFTSNYCQIFSERREYIKIKNLLKKYEYYFDISENLKSKIITFAQYELQINKQFNKYYYDGYSIIINKNDIQKYIKDLIISSSFLLHRNGKINECIKSLYHAKVIFSKIIPNSSKEKFKFDNITGNFSIEKLENDEKASINWWDVNYLDDDEYQSIMDLNIQRNNATHVPLSSSYDINSIENTIKAITKMYDHIFNGTLSKDFDFLKKQEIELIRKEKEKKHNIKKACIVGFIGSTDPKNLQVLKKEFSEEPTEEVLTNGSILEAIEELKSNSALKENFIFEENESPNFPLYLLFSREMKEEFNGKTYDEIREMYQVKDIHCLPLSANYLEKHNWINDDKNFLESNENIEYIDDYTYGKNEISLLCYNLFLKLKEKYNNIIFVLSSGIPACKLAMENFNNLYPYSSVKLEVTNPYDINREYFESPKRDSKLGQKQGPIELGEIISYSPLERIRIREEVLYAKKTYNLEYLCEILEKADYKKESLEKLKSFPSLHDETVINYLLNLHFCLEGNRLIDFINIIDAASEKICCENFINGKQWDVDFDTLFKDANINETQILVYKRTYQIIISNEKIKNVFEHNKKEYYIDYLLPDSNNDSFNIKTRKILSFIAYKYKSKSEILSKISKLNKCWKLISDFKHKYLLLNEYDDYIQVIYNSKKEKIAKKELMDSFQALLEISNQRANFDKELINVQKILEEF